MYNLDRIVIDKKFIENKLDDFDYIRKQFRNKWIFFFLLLFYLIYLYKLQIPHKKKKKKFVSNEFK